METYSEETCQGESTYSTKEREDFDSNVPALVISFDIHYSEHIKRHSPFQLVALSVGQLST